MEVILLEKVANLGNLGDKVNIKGGYARNFPAAAGQGHRRHRRERRCVRSTPRRAGKGCRREEGRCRSRAAQLSELVVTLGAHAGDEGKLFGSIGTRDIAEAVSAAGYPLEKAEVRLPNGALRNTGEFDVAVHLHTDVETTLKLIIVAE